MGAGVDDSYEVLMDKRIGRIAGFAAFVLMIVRLSRLIQSGDTAWHLIMIASAFLGGVIWWLLSQTVSNRKLAVGLFVGAGVVLFLRISAADTLVGGFLPSPDTFDALGVTMTEAIGLIRFGVAPVEPVAGVIAILSGLMWIVGGLYVWGSSDGSTAAMTLPSVALYLQFAVMDRFSAGIGWMIAAVIVIGLGIIAVGFDRKTEAGRVRDPEGRPIPRQTKATAFVIASVIAVGAVTTATTATSLVPPNGNFQWRVGSGYGPGYGGVTYDRLAGLQQRIISRSNAIVFTAALDKDAPPGNEVYWRMEALDNFDGTAWSTSGLTSIFDEPGNPGGNPDHAYRGTSQQIAATVRIEQLRMEVMPTAGIVYDMDVDVINRQLLQVAGDGSLIYTPKFNEGDRYTINRAVLPLYEADVAAMATTQDGTFSPLFAQAAEAGDFRYEPESRTGDTERPDDIDRFLQLPENLPVAIRAEAFARTEGAATDFESAWLLQHWFRDSGDFTYSTTVSTGAGSLELENWLTDSTSINYRTGYCGQFAASMAVLGRTLEIPSRVVWGFTPGEVSTGRDGTELITVRDNNAHAWVEMWMDGFGWVRFDPTPRGDGALPQSITASFDPVAYLPVPDTPTDIPLENRDELVPPGLLEAEALGGPLGQSSFPWEWLLTIPALVVMVGLVPWLKSLRRRRRLARLRTGDITAAWDEIVDRLTDLGKPVPGYETPMEFAARTDDSLISLATNYSAAVYGNRNGMATEADLEIVEDWLRRRYEGSQRFRAGLNPRSLFNSD